MSGLISAAVKRLRAALGLSSGAGLIGYASGDTYAAGTLGAGLKAEEGARASLASTVANNATTAANATTAVANDLEAHVSATATALASKAALAGNAAQVFALAAATAAEHGVRLGQFSITRSGDKWRIQVPLAGGGGALWIQGGSETSTTDAAETFAFLSPFAECLGCFLQNRTGNSSELMPFSAISVTNSGFTINRDADWDGSQPFYFLAIGLAPV